jgi:hypothetical protein
MAMAVAVPYCMICSQEGIGAGGAEIPSRYDRNNGMTNSAGQITSSHSKPATAASITLAFASVYFFWGSTYTAIRIGAAQMPALLLAGTRFLIAGAILLAWCR